MFLIKTKAATALILTLALATVTFGQQSQPTPRPAEAAPAPVDNTVDTQGFKGKIFEVKHRDPAAIMRAVSNLELVEDIGDVIAHRFAAEPQACGNLRVVVALRDQP